MQLDVLNNKGEVTGRKVELPEDIFNIEPNDHVIYLAVKQYRAAQRLGLHSTKTRAEVKGSSKKLHKQKGTGGARAGSIKSGVFVGGGRIHGPSPRDYSFKLNKKLKRLARLSAL
jgi:large subunit ribosomal protein L4